MNTINQQFEVKTDRASYQCSYRKKEDKNPDTDRWEVHFKNNKESGAEHCEGYFLSPNGVDANWVFQQIVKLDAAIL